MNARARPAAALVILGAIFAGPGPATPQEPPASGRPIVVASKAFAESYLLAEVFAQLLEEEGHRVERRLGLGSTEVIFQAVRTGAVDVYPEYTGTGLLVLLGETPQGGAEEVHRRVAEAFERRWDVRWLPPLGFENTYAISVLQETAEAHALRTLSDLAREAPSLVAGFSPDFLGREDGLPGLQERYGMEFREVRSLLQAIKYEALWSGRVDVVDAYSTDGRLAGRDVVILEDDLGFFPPYDAAPVVGARLREEVPEAVDALERLAGRLDEASMREWNRRVEVEGEDLAAVARHVLWSTGVADPSPAAPSEGAEPSGAVPAAAPAEQTLVEYAWSRRADLARQTLRHLVLVTSSLLAAIALAVPLGLLLDRLRGSAESVIRSVGLIQTIPSIALLAFMIPLLGVGAVPAVVALFLYSLFPILRNTFTGVRDADPTAVDAARALGMTELQLLRHVRLPLAAPVIMAGIRTAAVITVGTATLAAFIGAGGLGDPIVAGLALADTHMILSGALPAALLAFLVDAVLAFAERALRPRSLDRG